MASNMQVSIPDNRGRLIKETTEKKVTEIEVPLYSTERNPQENLHGDTTLTENETEAVQSHNGNSELQEGSGNDLQVQNAAHGEQLHEESEETMIKEFADAVISETRHQMGYPDGGERSSPSEGESNEMEREQEREPRQDIGRPDGDETDPFTGAGSDNEQNEEGERREGREGFDQPDGDEESEPDGEESGNEEQIRGEVEGPNPPDPDVAVPIFEEHQKRNDEIELQNRCEEVARRFTTCQELYKFACSSNGLKIDDEELMEIQYRESDGKIAMMELWRCSNRGATCKQLNDILDNYFAQAGKFHIQLQEENAEGKIRMEDVFLQVCGSFRRLSDFKRFARAGNGLRLFSTMINQIDDSYKKDSHRQMIEMLRHWRLTTKGATPEMLIDIRDRYMGSSP